MKADQIPLFETVLRCYGDAPDGVLSTKELYEAVAEKLNLTREQQEERGCSKGRSFNRFQRDCRWVQQQLKARNLLRRIDRGMWGVTTGGREELSVIGDSYACLAFCTDLGIAVWGEARHVGEEVINEPINLILTSPPYLNVDRPYGKIECEKTYCDWLVSVLEPYIKKMAPGAGLVLNISNDLFNKGSASRSVALERIVLALHDDLGLSMVDRIIWQVNKCPGPTQYAFVRRVMLRAGFEFSLVMTNDPDAMEWDNRRVLEAQDPKYLQWCRQGGQKTAWRNSDYSKRSGAFSGTQEEISRIPTNIIKIGNNCKSTRHVKAFAREHGLPEHTAVFPRAFAEFFIKWITRAGQLVVDPFGGTVTTGAAAQVLGRRWVSSDRVLEYLQCGSSRFPWVVPNPQLLWPGEAA